MEKRSFGLDGLEIRKGENATTVRGYAAMFGRMSQPMGGFREVIAPGAFAGSLGEDIRALWQHDSKQVLGRTKAGTLALWEDAQGLGFELTPPDTQAGRDALVLIARGDVDQMSFGFNVAQGGDSWEAQADGLLVRTLNEVRLVEISPVTFPAYLDTSVTVARSETLDCAPEWVRRALAQGVDHISAEGARARLRTLQRRVNLLRMRGHGR